eukprot:symbB.v1.2.022089.t1/scaffold1946.1/size95412/1
MGEHRDQVFQEYRDIKRQPSWSKRRGALLGLGLGIAAIASLAWRTTTTEFGGRFDPATLSVGDLLQIFSETREYLYASGWREQDGTFVPQKPADRFGEPKTSTPKLTGMRRYYTRVSKKNACGAGIRDVMHFTAVLPEVDVKYVMEALTNPGFTNWNPTLHGVTFRRHRRLPLDANLKDTFTSQELKVKDGYSHLEQSKDTIDVAAQVSELMVPKVVEKAAGRRFTSDYIAIRYDCKANRGFSIATSVGTEEVAKAAGVRKMQDLCLTSMMVAPDIASNDTMIHIVSHFDPQVPTTMLQKAVHYAVGRSTRHCFLNLHSHLPLRGGHRTSSILPDAERLLARN